MHDKVTQDKMSPDDLGGSASGTASKKVAGSSTSVQEPLKKVSEKVGQASCEAVGCSDRQEPSSASADCLPCKALASQLQASNDTSRGPLSVCGTDACYLANGTDISKSSCIATRQNPKRAASLKKPSASGKLVCQAGQKNTGVSKKEAGFGNFWNSLKKFTRKRSFRKVTHDASDWGAIENIGNMFKKDDLGLKQNAQAFSCRSSSRKVESSSRRGEREPKGNKTEISRKKSFNTVEFLHLDGSGSSHSSDLNDLPHFMRHAPENCLPDGNEGGPAYRNFSGLENLNTTRENDPQNLDKDLDSSVTEDISGENNSNDFPVISSHVIPLSLHDGIEEMMPIYPGTSPESDVTHPIACTGAIAMDAVNSTALEPSDIGVISQNAEAVETSIPANSQSNLCTVPDGFIPVSSAMLQKSTDHGWDTAITRDKSTEAIYSTALAPSDTVFISQNAESVETSIHANLQSNNCTLPDGSMPVSSAMLQQSTDHSGDTAVTGDKSCDFQLSEIHSDGKLANGLVDLDRTAEAGISKIPEYKVEDETKSLKCYNRRTFKKPSRNILDQEPQVEKSSGAVNLLHCQENFHGKFDDQSCLSSSVGGTIKDAEAVESNSEAPGGTHCAIKQHPDNQHEKEEALVNKVEMKASIGQDCSNLSLQEGVGWVCCDNCSKWRSIPEKLADIIEETNCGWTCRDNNDKRFADCSISQEKSNAEINAELGIPDEEDIWDLRQYDNLSDNNQAPWISIRSNLYLHRSRKKQTIDEIMVCHCEPSLDGSRGCTSGCLNRMLNIECIRGTCPYGDLCSNQQFQRRKYAKMKCFLSGKKGCGLKLLENVSEGDFLIEYVGEVLDMATYEARQLEYASKGQEHFYFMTLNGHEVIDACRKGNLGRFINHSCEPNCRTEKWMVKGEVCIGLFAIRDISKGEEITFDYNYVRVVGAAAKKCFCGSAICRGFIGGDPFNGENIAHYEIDGQIAGSTIIGKDRAVDLDLKQRVSSATAITNVSVRNNTQELNVEKKIQEPILANPQQHEVDPRCIKGTTDKSLQVNLEPGDRSSLGSACKSLHDVCGSPVIISQRKFRAESNLDKRASMSSIASDHRMANMKSRRPKLSHLGAKNKFLSRSANGKSLCGASKVKSLSRTADNDKSLSGASKVKSLSRTAANDKSLFGTTANDKNLSGAVVNDKCLFGAAANDKSLSDSATNDKNSSGATTNDKYLSGAVVNDKSLSGAAANDKSLSITSKDGWFLSGTAKDKCLSRAANDKCLSKAANDKCLSKAANDKSLPGAANNKSLSGAVNAKSSSDLQAFDEKLNALVDSDGGLLMKKDSTKRYLKLLLVTLTTTSSSVGNDFIRSVRQLLFLLNVLLKTESQAILTDIINRNVFQMLHTLMGQKQGNLYMIPVIRKILKVLEFFDSKGLLTVDQINMDPPHEGVESFRDSILRLARHDDYQIRTAARDFRNKWMPRMPRRTNQHYRDRRWHDPRNESRSSLLPCKREAESFGKDIEHGIRGNKRIHNSSPCASRSPRGDVSFADKKSCDPPPQDVGFRSAANEVKTPHKRRSRWDQDKPSDKRCKSMASENSSQQSIDDEAPPGFAPPLGYCSPHEAGVAEFTTAAVPSTSGSLVEGEVQERYTSQLTVSHGIPWTLMQQLGTPGGANGNNNNLHSHSWAIAPGTPFHPFPPLPPYARESSQASSLASTYAGGCSHPNGQSTSSQHHPSFPCVSRGMPAICSRTGSATYPDKNPTLFAGRSSFRRESGNNYCGGYGRSRPPLPPDRRHHQFKANAKKDFRKKGGDGNFGRGQGSGGSAFYGQ